MRSGGSPRTIVSHRQGGIEMFRKIIVGVDEHQGGRDAEALAKHLVATDGSVTLARVLIRDSLIGRNASPDFDSVERRHGMALQSAAQDELRVDGPVRFVDASS